MDYQMLLGFILGVASSISTLIIQEIIFCFRLKKAARKEILSMMFEISQTLTQEFNNYSHNHNYTLQKPIQSHIAGLISLYSRHILYMSDSLQTAYQEFMSSLNILLYFVNTPDMFGKIDADHCLKICKDLNCSVSGLKLEFNYFHKFRSIMTKDIKFSDILNYCKKKNKEKRTKQKK